MWKAIQDPPYPFEEAGRCRLTAKIKRKLGHSNISETDSSDNAKSLAIPTMISAVKKKQPKKEQLKVEA